MMQHEALAILRRFVFLPVTVEAHSSAVGINRVGLNGRPAVEPNPKSTITRTMRAEERARGDAYVSTTELDAGGHAGMTYM